VHDSNHAYLSSSEYLDQPAVVDAATLERDFVLAQARSSRPNAVRDRNH
jgi:hypothetical protein